MLLVSLHDVTHDRKYLDEAEWLVSDVLSVLGRTKGIRIGQEADRYGQYSHYLSMWMYALFRLSQHRPKYRDMAIALVKQTHPAFVVKRRGVWWKVRPKR